LASIDLLVAFEDRRATIAEQFEGVAEADAIVPLDELDWVARLAAMAGHAAEQALCRGDDEVGRFLVIVKWTKSDPIFALLLEFDPPRLDQADEVGFRFDAFDVSFGYSWHGKFFN
jgi:hypothetical protein